MTIQNQVELLTDALESGRDVVVLNEREYSLPHLFAYTYNLSIRNQENAFSHEQATQLATLIGHQSSIDGKTAIQLAMLPDDLAQTFINASAEAQNPIKGEDIAGGIGGLISKGNLNAASSLVEMAEKQGTSFSLEQGFSFSQAFARCAKTIGGSRSNAAKAESESALVGLLEKLPWDINQQIKGRTLTEYFKNEDLAQPYDHVTRVMAENIKQQAQLQSEEAQESAGSSINLRGSL